MIKLPIILASGIAAVPCYAQNVRVFSGAKNTFMDRGRLVTAAVERRQSHSAAASNRRASASTAAAAASGLLALSTGDEPDNNQSKR
jgi:hypothetical protein